MPPRPNDSRWTVLTFVVVVALSAVTLVYVTTRGGGPSAPVSPSVAWVAGAPTTPTVTETGFGGSRPAGAVGRTTPGGAAGQGPAVVLSKPEPVTGYGTVGVTWAPSPATGSDVRVWARTRLDGTWGDWVDFEYDAEHEPDPSSGDGQSARPGTDAYPVGEVDAVQVKVSAPSVESLPTDLRLAVVDPGAEASPRRSTAAIPAEVEEAGDAELSAAGDGVPARPAIFSRAQWGADESMRDRSSLHYGRVTMGFVHHTVNANDYTRDQVPALLRGIYAYHTRSRGWSDVGYNFLVDRFGRIWEGRYGGVARPVVGAHTLGYNDDAFAMSAIGNFEVTRPGQAVLDAYAQLFAWKLSLHGASANARQTLRGRTFPTVSGHRDAGSTACPGQYLYARLGDLRQATAALQKPFTSRQLSTDLGGAPSPDAILRDATTKRALVVHFAADGSSAPTLVRTALDLRGVVAIFNVGDWNGDGIGDVIARLGSSSGRRLVLYAGGAEQDGVPTFSPPVVMNLDTSSFRRLTPVGDLTGDGRPDLVALDRARTLRVLPGDGRAGFGAGYPVRGAGRPALGIGLWDRDGSPDLAERRDGTLYLLRGNGPGFATTTTIRVGDVTGYNRLRMSTDVTGDGRPDVLARRRGSEGLWLLPSAGEGLGAPRRLAVELPRFDLIG